MEKSDIIVIIGIIVVLVLSWQDTIKQEAMANSDIAKYSNDIQLQKCLAEVNITQRFRMFSPTLEDESSYVDGVYKGDGEDYGFFCVWTKDQKMNDVSDTILHEWLHAAIIQDPELKQHFCGN